LYQNYVILRNALDFFWKLCSRGEAPAGVGYKKAKKTGQRTKVQRAPKRYRRRKKAKQSYLGSSERARRIPTRFEYYLPN